MPKVIETTVYEYEELSDKAKEKARDWYRELAFSDSSDWDTTIEDAVQMGEILGISFKRREVEYMSGRKGSEPCVYFSGFWCQGDGASFEGSYSYAKGALKKIKAEVPLDSDLHQIAAELQEIQRRYKWQLTAWITTSGGYSHSTSMDVDTEADVMDVSVEDQNAVRRLMRRFADWIYEQLKAEYEYQTSDEVIAENIIANEYFFTADGKRRG